MRCYSKKIVIILFLCLNFLLLFSSCYSSEEKYPYGQDTEVYIGDGRFQIARVRFIDTDQYDTYVVVDPDGTTDNGNIESDVFLYYDDTENKKLYLVGSNGRTIVDYKKAKWKTNLQDDDMTYSEKNVFANKSLFKTP